MENVEKEIEILRKQQLIENILNKNAMNVDALILATKENPNASMKEILKRRDEIVKAKMKERESKQQLDDNKMELLKKSVSILGYNNLSEEEKDLINKEKSENKKRQAKINKVVLAYANKLKQDGKNNKDSEVSLLKNFKNKADTENKKRQQFVNYIEESKHLKDKEKLNIKISKYKIDNAIHSYQSSMKHVPENNAVLSRKRDLNQKILLLEKSGYCLKDNKIALTPESDKGNSFDMYI